MRVGHSSAVSAASFELRVLALGTTRASGLALRLPARASASVSAFVDDGIFVMPLVPNPLESDLVLPVASNVRDGFFGGATGFLNTEPGGSSAVSRTLVLSLQFAAPQPFDPAAAPFDLFLQRAEDRSHQVHRAAYPGTDVMNASLFGTGDDASAFPLPGPNFVDAAGITFVLHIPEPSADVWPTEGSRIDVAFPNILDFAASGGAQSQDWHDYPEPLFVIPEPSSLGLLAVGLGGALLGRRWRS